MRTKYNLIRRITDKRRMTKDGRKALAVYLGIKLDHSNSIHYGATVRELKAYFRCGTTMACTIRRIIHEDEELFSCNDTKNVVFANSCKSDEVKHSRGRVKNEYRGDDVIVIDIPQCYLDGSNHLSLQQLLKLLDRVLIQKEYDDGANYKLNAGAERSSVCEREVKSQAYVSQATGIKRTTLGRRLKEMVNEGILVKLSEKRLERCSKSDKGAFLAVNKITRLPYYLKSVPVAFAIVAGTCAFTHVIWDAPKRVNSQHLKSDDRQRKEIVAKAIAPMTDEELELRLKAEREFEKRMLYD